MSASRDKDNKRKRLTQACELCRRKKIRCDGGKPTCANCTRLNSDCIYSLSSKKRGPRQGYIEMLEKRLAKMEEILLSPEAASTSKKTTIEEEEEEDIDDEYDDNEELPATTTNSILNPTEEHSFIPSHKTKVSSKRSSEDNRDCTSPTSFSSISSNFPSPPAHSSTHHLSKPDDILPSVDVIEHIVDLYFKYLFAALPIFHEDTLRNDLKERKCSDFLLLSLLGACARFSDRPDIKESPAWHAGEKFAEKARSMIIKAVDEPNMSNLQALTLLTLHEYGCGRGPRSWMYGGMAIRMAMELGLHEDLDEDDGSDSETIEKLITQETRRRLFWTIFTIDKFSSAATGRPSILQEQFCTAFLPANVDAYNKERYYTETLDNSRYILLNVNGLRESQLLGTQPSSISPSLGRRPSLNCFSYLIRATNLLGKVTSYVNLKGKEIKNSLPPCHHDSEFSKLDRMIEDWYEQLPMLLKNTPANFELHKDSANPGKNRQFILLHILHNTLRVLLHRPSLVVADTLDNDIVQPEIKQFIHQSVEKCMTAVDNVTVLLNEIGLQMELMPPFLSYLAYTVATVVVSTSFSSRPEEAQKAKQALGVYFQLLLAARNYWAMADKLYFMIRDLYAIHSNVVKRQEDHSTQERQQKQQQVYQRQQQEQILQQQFQQQLQQQQLQLQHLNHLELPAAGSNTYGDWNLPFYNSTLINGTAGFAFDARDDLSSTNIFQLPEGYDQPLMFPSTPQHRDVNNNGM